MRSEDAARNVELPGEVDRAVWNPPVYGSTATRRTCHPTSQARGYASAPAAPTQSAREVRKGHMPMLA